MLAEPMRITVSPPDMREQAEARTARLFSDARVVRSEPVRLKRLVNVRFNEAGEFFLPEGISPDWFASDEAYRRRDATRFERKFNRCSQNPRPFFLAGSHGDAAPFWITDRYSHVYYHWLTHALARLEAVVQAGFSGTLLLPHWIAQLSFVRESLEAYPGIEPQYAGTGNWSVDEINLVTRCSVPPDMHPVLVKDVARRLARHFAPDTKPTGRRVYVTRRLARNRRIVNEDELLPVLARHGFEIVEMERLPLGEQTRLMREVTVLAGPHGAGLTNMMFMGEGAVLLELRQLEGPPLSFMKMAGVFAQRYRYCVCENAEPGMHHHGALVYLDPDRLEAELSQLP